MWTAVTWEITENSIGYQGPYVALAAAFVPSVGEIFSDGFESGDTSAWSASIGSIWQPGPGTSWQWQLQGTIDTTIDVEYSGDESVFCPYFNALGYSWMKKHLDLGVWRIDCNDLR